MSTVFHQQVSKSVPKIQIGSDYEAEAQRIRDLGYELPCIHGISTTEIIPEDAPPYSIVEGKYRVFCSGKNTFSIQRIRDNRILEWAIAMPIMVGVLRSLVKWEV